MADAAGTGMEAGAMDRAEARGGPGARVARVLTYNILAGGGSRLDAIEAVIRDTQADVVALQEVLDPQVLPALAERLGMHHAFSPSPTKWSVGLLSRWPLCDVDTAGSERMRKALLAVTVAPPGSAPLRVYATHLAADYAEPLAGELRRYREVGVVLARMHASRAAGEPHLVMGDFNTLAPGEPLQASAVLRLALQVDAAHAAGKPMPGLPDVAAVVPRPLLPLRPVLRAIAASNTLSRLFDLAVSASVPRFVIRRLLASGYIDCYAATHPVRAERERTCPIHAPAGRIDYIFASPTLAARLRSCDILTDTPSRPISVASDHRPVLAEFCLSA